MGCLSIAGSPANYSWVERSKYRVKSLAQGHRRTNHGDLAEYRTRDLPHQSLALLPLHHRSPTHLNKIWRHSMNNLNAKLKMASNCICSNFEKPSQGKCYMFWRNFQNRQVWIIGLSLCFGMFGTCSGVDLSKVHCGGIHKNFPNFRTRPVHEM